MGQLGFVFTGKKSEKNIFEKKVDHDFHGHEDNKMYGVNGKKCYDRANHLVNKLHDITGLHGLSGNFCYDDLELVRVIYCYSEFQLAQ